MKNIHDELQEYWCGYFVGELPKEAFPINAANILTEYDRPFGLLYSYAYNDTREKALSDQ